MKQIKTFIAAVIILGLHACTPGQERDEWISLFNGNDLNGWKASENPESFSVEDSAIVCNGPRAHLFYDGDIQQANFKNFELKADVKSSPGANSGIYFHTAFQDEGWPDKGYEVQVFNNYPVEPEGYKELKKTGSLYAVRNLYNTFTQDNEWFNMHVKVEGRRVTISVNDQLVVDYIEPENPVRTDGFKGRLLSSGTFALQCHDPESKVYFKNIKIRPLPDETQYDNAEPYLSDELNQEITHLHNIGFPLMDLHVHLKGGLTMEEALDESRKKGINYGILSGSNRYL